MAGGRSSIDGAWRWSPWGVAPDAIPGRDVDPGAVRAAAIELTATARQVRDTGADVRRTWHGLGAHYEAPEAPRLLAAMDPVERDTREVGDGVEIVAVALRRYADEVEPLIGRLATLRREAWAVDDVVRRHTDWRADAELVTRAASVRRQVAVAVTALEEAEERCAAAIRAASGPPPTCVPATVAAPPEPRSWWGPITGEGERCSRSAAGHLKSFLDGVIIDGLIGGYLGTAALAGLTLDGFSWETFEAAWTGVFDLATPGSVIWMLRRPDPSVTRDAWGGMVEGLVAADQWQENPARAAGAVLFTLGTAFLPGGGLKSAATGASAAARSAGRAARVADDVAAEAAAVAAKAEAPEMTPRVIHEGQQNKHIRGHPDFLETRGEVSADPHALAQRAGTGEPVNKVPVGRYGYRERVVYDEIIGIYRGKDGDAASTTVGIIHYRKTGIHIVPGRPQGGN